MQTTVNPAVWQQLPALVKAYQLPDNKKATMQAITSFGPFLAIWVAMYLLMDVSMWATVLLGIVNAFSWCVFLLFNMIVGTNRLQLLAKPMTSLGKFVVTLRLSLTVIGQKAITSTMDTMVYCGNIGISVMLTCSQ